MAITINRRANVDGDNLYEYDLKGLSTDTKPTQIGGQDIEDNSLFLELDTGDFYYLSGGTWVKVGEAPTPPTPSETVLEDVFKTDNVLTKSSSEYITFFTPYIDVDSETGLKSNIQMTMTIGDTEYSSNYYVNVGATDIYFSCGGNYFENNGGNDVYWVDESGELTPPGTNTYFKITLTEV